MASGKGLVIGFEQSESVEKGPFLNAVLLVDGVPYDGAAYIATDDDGKPVTLNVRIAIDDEAVPIIRSSDIPIRGKTQWSWPSGESQPVGRKGSRWTVGGPRVTTTRGKVTQPTGIGAALMGKDMMVNVRDVMPIAPRGNLNAAQRAVCEAHNLTPSTLRGLAISIS